MSRLGPRAAVLGASGAIGGALVRELAARGVAEIYALARGAAPPAAAMVTALRADCLDEDSLATAAARIAADGPLDTVIIATGLLHAPGLMPEKALRDVTAAAMAAVFAANCIGPALAMKHFLPLLPRAQRARLAVLSARVGSISDNLKGGWYGYRTAKAGLNMMVRSAAIEVARRAPQAVVVALHPGTVESALSAPFRNIIPPGQMVSPQVAARRLADVLERLEPAQSGQMIAYDGQVIPP